MSSPQAPPIVLTSDVELVDQPSMTFNPPSQLETPKESGSYGWTVIVGIVVIILLVIVVKMYRQEQSRALALEADIARLDETVNVKVSEAGELQKDIAELEDIQATMDSDKEEVDEDLVEAVNELKKCKSAHAASLIEIAKASTDMSNLIKDHKDELSTMLDQNAKEAATIHKKNAALEAQLDQDIKKLTDSNKNLTISNADLVKRHQVAVDARMSMEHKYIPLNTKYSALQKAFNLMKSNLAKCESASKNTSVKMISAITKVGVVSNSLSKGFCTSPDTLKKIENYFKGKQRLSYAKAHAGGWIGGSTCTARIESRSNPAGTLRTINFNSSKNPTSMGVDGSGMAMAFRRISRKDSHGGDIKGANMPAASPNLPKQTRDNNLAAMAAKCYKDKNCKGFNSNGWLKSSIAPDSKMIYSGGSDMYVRK